MKGSSDYLGNSYDDSINNSMISGSRLAVSFKRLILLDQNYPFDISIKQIDDLYFIQKR